MGLKVYVHRRKNINFLGGAQQQLEPLFLREVLVLCTYTYFTKQKICGEWESFEKSLF